jgi:hypothetical protein
MIRPWYRNPIDTLADVQYDRSCGQGPRFVVEPWAVLPARSRALHAVEPTPSTVRYNSDLTPRRGCRQEDHKNSEGRDAFSQDFC